MPRYPYEGVIHCGLSGLNGHTFKLATILSYRKGIAGYLEAQHVRLGYPLPVKLRLTATDTLETGPDGVQRLVFSKPPRERKRRHA
jgi:hypothetical protein